MTTFSVWAPRAGLVEIEIDGQRHALTSGERGYHRWEHAALAAGTEYGLRLDGGPLLPDPRSPEQPRGVHGPSRVVDHAAFVWTDAGFTPRPLAQAIVYELHVGTFTEPGTFAAVIDRLDYLVELGVSHLELMPVVEIPGERGWGYDGVALFAPYRCYGRPDDLKRLVDACHTRGIAVLLDVVYNHLGPDGNYLGQFGPYFTDALRTPWGDAVNLEGEGSDEVRRFFCDNALYWLEHYHVDGLRLDAVHAFMDRSALHFLEQLAIEVEQLGRRLGKSKVLIAESDLNDPRLVRERQLGGYGLDAQWSDDFHHCLHALLTGERSSYYGDFGQIAQLARALERGFAYEGEHSPHRKRVHGRPLGNLPLSRLLGYLQNHDQVGNRAQGDRIGRQLSVEQLELGAAFVMLGPFVPMIFQGEEWNASSPFLYFTDHQDPGLAEAVRQGRRREFAAFGWKPEEVPDPQARSSFERSKLRWDELERAEHARVLDWYRRLAELRRSHPALTAEGLPSVRVDGSCLAMQRGSLVLLGNFGPQPVTRSLPPDVEWLLSSAGVSPAQGVLSLPGWGVLLCRSLSGDPPTA
jgi:maltooligosyltrehalose trehalohydrolase